MTISSIISIGSKGLGFLKKIPKDIYWIVIVAALSVLLLGQCAANQKKDNDTERLRKNYSELQRKADEQTKQFTITEGELAAEISKVEYLKNTLDSLKIASKNVDRVQRYESVRYVHDTLVKVYWRDINGLNYYETTKEGCNFKVTTGWFEGDSTASVKAEIRTDLSFVNYWKRKKLFGWNWTPKWGKKEFVSIVIDECQQDSILNNAVFEKVK